MQFGESICVGCHVMQAGFEECCIRFVEIMAQGCAEAVFGVEGRDG